MSCIMCGVYLALCWVYLVDGVHCRLDLLELMMGWMWPERKRQDVCSQREFGPAFDCSKVIISTSLQKTSDDQLYGDKSLSFLALFVAVVCALEE